MFSILSIAVLSDFMTASPEPMSIMLWGIALILFSIKLRSRKAEPRELKAAADAVKHPLGQPFAAGVR